MVIVAGGEGRRLDPFTRVLPKALLPIEDKTMIELIMEKFSQWGFDEFYLLLNKKGSIIKAYLEARDLPYRIHYIWEPKLLGTAGGLGLLPEHIAAPFFVTYCDIMVNANYNEFLDQHLAQENALTLIGSEKKYHIPYGILELGQGNRVERIKEKPQIEFVINSGVYCLSRQGLAHIPPNRKWHMTDLIAELQEGNSRVGCFKIGESGYFDVGQWDEFNKNQDFLGRTLK